MAEIEEPTKKQTAKDKSEDSFDIVGLLLDFLGHWKWFVLCIVIALGCAWYYNKTIIPTYGVSASVYLQADDVKARNKIMGGVSMEGERWIDETEIEKIKSRNNMVRIVDSLGLAYSYYNTNRFRDIPIYRTNAVVAEMDSLDLYNLEGALSLSVEPQGGKFKVVSKGSNDGLATDKVIMLDSLPGEIHTVKGTIRLSLSPVAPKMEHLEKIVIRNPRDVSGSLSGSINIQYAEYSDQILRITYNTPIIEQGKDIINALIAFYNQDIIAEKNRAAIQTEAFIRDRLAVVAKELGQVDREKEQYEKDNNITNLETQAGAALNIQSQTEQQIAQLRAQEALLGSLEGAVRSANYTTTLPTTSDDPGVASAIDNYNQKVLAFNSVSEGYGDEHPMVIKHQEDATALKSVVMDKISASRKTLNAQISALSEAHAKSTQQMRANPTMDKGLQEILRDQQVKVNIYTYLLQKREELALEKTMATPTAQLIDNPTGFGPIAPNSGMIYIVAFLIGFGIPALFFLLRKLLFPVFKDQDDLERLSSVPVLGEIYKTDKNAGHIVVGDNVSTNIAELFRLVRNNLQFALGDPRKKVVLVSSAIAGEGKTFVAINTALTFAITGKRVVIIGMDIRRPTLAARFGLNNDEGLTNYLSGQITDVNDIIFPSGVNENLDVIPAGPIPPNPNELLMSHNMDRLFAKLREEYDYIFLDTAPIGLISDTYLIAPHSDVQIFVVRANYSTRRCIRFMHKAIEGERFNNCYVVLNAVNFRASGYAYRRYGYYNSATMGSYGYSSRRNEKPTPWRRFKRLLRKANRKTRK